MSERAVDVRRPNSIGVQASDRMLGSIFVGHGTAQILRDSPASQPDLSWSLTELSVLICEIYGVCARHEDDRQLRVELSAVATHIEDIVHDLLIPPNHAHAAPRRGNPKASHPSAVVFRQHQHEEAFIAWLNSVTKPEAIALDGPGSGPTSLTLALGQLVTSQRELASDQASLLGLETPATVGDAATVLLQAVKNPAGPRCRSYRAAYHYLTALS